MFLSPVLANAFKIFSIYAHYQYYSSLLNPQINCFKCNVLFPTLSSVPSAPPLNVSLSASDHSTLLVSWDPVEVYHQNGIVRSYRVVITDSANISSTLTLSVNDSITAVTVANLQPHHIYIVQVAAYTVGVGPYSDEVNITMPETGKYISCMLNSLGRHYTYYFQTFPSDQCNYCFYYYQLVIATVPSESPSGFIAMLEQNLTVHFSWVSPPAGALNGILLGYTVSCTALNQHSLTVSVLGTSTSVHSLQADTHYTCTVCAYTVVGCGPTETVHISTYGGCESICDIFYVTVSIPFPLPSLPSFFRPIAPIGPPVSVAADGVTSTVIPLQWTAPFDPDNEIIGYGVTYQLIQTSWPVEVPRPPVTVASQSTNTKYTIESLLANSVYRIVVFAVFDEGTGPFSEEITVTTEAKGKGGLIFQI